MSYKLASVNAKCSMPKRSVSSISKSKVKEFKEGSIILFDRFARKKE